MASRIIEFFGYDPADTSSAARQARKEEYCPFLGDTCQKTLSDGLISGACTLQAVRGTPVICCPIRLYANNYEILRDVATIAFQQKVDLYPGAKATHAAQKEGHVRIAVFGRGWGGELHIPNRGRSGSYFVDWILARLNKTGELEDFIAVEVQSIDTTGNYREERDAYIRGEKFEEYSTAGFNWENVNKRILPQLIYKGHVLRRERLCKSGLYFVCPLPVYDKIRERLGGNIAKYEPQPGALTFIWYDVGSATPKGQIRELKRIDKFTTTVDQVAVAFTSPSNLPEANVYERAIRSELVP